MLTPESLNESTYAFILHCPTNDDESIQQQQQQYQQQQQQAVRQRRRRTSPAELSLLEAEFQKSKKPSKAERDSIAKRVGMPVKTVQIWFQNRRQAFRKSQNQPGTGNEKENQDPGSDANDSAKDDENDNNRVGGLGKRPPSTGYQCQVSRSASIKKKKTGVSEGQQSPHYVCLSMSIDGKAQVVVQSPMSKRMKPVENWSRTPENHDDTTNGRPRLARADLSSLSIPSLISESLSSASSSRSSSPELITPPGLSYGADGTVVRTFTNGESYNNKQYNNNSLGGEGSSDSFMGEGCPRKRGLNRTRSLHATGTGIGSRTNNNGGGARGVSRSQSLKERRGQNRTEMKYNSCIVNDKEAECIKNLLSLRSAVW